jgi:hypothetical protein
VHVLLSLLDEDALLLLLAPSSSSSDMECDILTVLLECFWSLSFLIVFRRIVLRFVCLIMEEKNILPPAELLRKCSVEYFCEGPIGRVFPLTWYSDIIRQKGELYSLADFAFQLNI